jgi:hypothetical protein
MSSVDIRVVYSNIRYKANELLAIPKKKYENLYKTSLCNSIKLGIKCSFGDNCNFAHSSSELKTRKCLFGPACTNDYCNLFHEDVDPNKYLDKLIQEINDYKNSTIKKPIQEPLVKESFIINLEDDEEEEYEEEYVDEQEEIKVIEVPSNKNPFQFDKTPLIECEQDVYDFMKWECEQEKLEREQKLEKEQANEFHGFSLPSPVIKEKLTERCLTDAKTPFSSPAVNFTNQLNSNMLNTLQKQTINNLSSQNMQLQIQLFNAYTEIKKQQERISELENLLSIQNK